MGRETYRPLAKKKWAPKCPKSNGIAANSIQVKQLLHHLINVALPFWNISDGQDGVNAVVAARIDGFNVEPLQLKNAKDVTVFNNALRQTNAMVPHVVRFFI